MKRIPFPFFLVPLLALMATPAKAQTNFTKLKSFSIISSGGGFIYPDGSIPMGSLVADSNGILYGTTEAGGVTNAGTVFRISEDGTGFALLKSFLISDGSYPFASLLLSKEGTLFGTTWGGGTSNYGTIFSLGRDGTAFSVLHSFLGGSDGMNPRSALIEASDGALYGVTPNGNATAQGTIFRINKDGSGYSVIFAFPGFAAGVQPYGRLLEGSDGLLYGTTIAGGSPGGGVVFSIARDGSVYTILHNFKGSDGLIPNSGLIEASDGVLYGTTSRGGAANSGTVFKMNKDGSGYNIIRNFSGTAGDAASPRRELIESSGGVLYGGAKLGGGGDGAVYSLNKDGSGYAILRGFLGPGGDGGDPSSLLELSTGVFCGTTSDGAGDAGSVFTLSNFPLPPRGISVSVSGTSNLVQFAATSGIQYDVLRSLDLSSWNTVGTVTSPMNGQISFPDINPPQPAAFYRLRQH